MSEFYSFTAGDGPLLVSCPHAGTVVPHEIADRFTEAGRLLPDTDWHVDRLYDFVAGLGAGLLVASHSRYVVDLNRDPTGKPLYPGADNTAICPTRTFAGEAIYQEGQAPDDEEKERRIATYWQPYHQKLASELAAIRQKHGRAVLLDGHSIRSHVPRFFEGRLPDLNFGTARNTSADRELARRAYAVLEGAQGYTSVRDGRFTGGYITRHYGQPAAGLHAMQIEISQITYMEEKPPFRYRPDRAQALKPVLRRVTETILEWAKGG